MVEHCHPTHGGAARQGSDHAFKWPLRFRAILGVALVSLACLTTGSGLLSEVRRGAFAQAAPASPRLVDGNGTPVGGWWALVPSPQQGRIAVLARWKPTAAMHTARSGHTATLLPSGQILIAGGGNPTEVYNPMTGQWTLTGALHTDRLEHTATHLPSGKVLVAGGWWGQFLTLASTEVYDPVTAQWTPTGSLRTARFAHTATLLPSGKVLVAGGGDWNAAAPFASAELYDPATGQRTLTGALNTARTDHTATLLPSGKVLVAGGDNSLTTFASAELYDPATGQWTLTGALNTARTDHTATLLPSGKVLVAGGSTKPVGGDYLDTAEVYDSATGQWTLTGALHTARADHTATLLPSGQVLVAGGFGGSPLSQLSLASTEVYNPAMGQWVLTAALNTPREYHTATLLPSGQVLVAGGQGGAPQPLASAELPETFQSVVADGASTQIDDTALFDFTNPHRPLVRAAGGLPLDLAKVDQSGDWTAVVDNPPRTATFFQNTPLVVTDLGKYQVQLGVRRRDSSLASFFLKTTLAYPTVMAHYDPPPPDPAPVPLTVLFRFFPDGTQVGALQQGEVAIFQKCNYQGNAAVFIADVPNLAALTSSDVTLDKSAASVRLGNNTGIVLYTGNGYTGTSQVVETDTPCLTATPIGNNTTSSFQIEPLAPNLMRSSNACENCQLVGADLSDLNLSGFDFQGAILDNATGLAGTTAQPSQLSGVLFNNASLKNVDLSNALLYGANFTNANLENASLSGAFLTNNLSVSPPIRAPANFTGAHLKNVNLSGAKLDGVLFEHASFYGSFNGIAPTFPCQTDTTQCPKTGFTCSCATAVGASMVRTDFSNAYLYGVDFGGSTTIINGVRFTGAVLVGANFTGATFAVDPKQGGAPPDFSSAYLQGVQFDPTGNLTDTSLSGAFVDFGATGNIMQLLLGPAYTAFHGWEAPNQPVCVQAAYASFTVVPTTIPTMTCPDSNTYAAGCGPTQAGNLRWASQTPIGQTSPPGWYQFDATYTKADQSNACNANTFNLDW